MKNAKGKAPSFQFYVKDWLSDPELQKAHPTTRGIWINLLCYMWDAPERGKVETNERELCQLGSCLPEDVRLFLSDVKRLNFCDFSETCHKNVTGGHSYVTLKNRRMRRDEKYRIKARKRKQKQRKKEIEVEEVEESHRIVTQNGNHTPTPTPTPTPNAGIIKDEQPEKDPAPKINKLGNWIDENPGIKIYLKKFSETSWPKIRTAIGEALKKNKHQGAIKDLIIYIHGRKIDKPNDYFWKTINIISGNYYAAESEKEHKKTKSQEFPDLKSVFNNMLKETK